MDKEFENIMTYKKGFSMMQYISIISIVLGLGTGVGSYVYHEIKLGELHQQLFQAQKNPWVLDIKSGSVGRANLNYTSDDKKIEYKHHITMFYNTFYTFDQFNFDSNVDKALNLIGDKGKELLALYEEKEIKKKLIEGNMEITTKVEKINFDPKNPYHGISYAIQTLRKGKNIARRKVNAEFLLEPCGRSDKNPHGVLIKTWKIIDNAKVK